jgi:hypothetical protein
MISTNFDFKLITILGHQSIMGKPLQAESLFFSIFSNNFHFLGINKTAKMI